MKIILSSGAILITDSKNSDSGDKAPLNFGIFKFAKRLSF
jgi:hypothetical protein